VIDVGALGCDFLFCSAYKFFGPHVGVLWGRHELLAESAIDKVRPAPEQPPARWETGTVNIEGLAGLRACVGYLAELGGGSATAPERAALVRAWDRIGAHETELSRRFLAGIAELPGLRCVGVLDCDGPSMRTPTFGLLIDGLPAPQAAERLGERGICCWSGHFYAVELVQQLDLAAVGGLLRIGFAHYHRDDDVDRCCAELRALLRPA